MPEAVQLSLLTPRRDSTEPKSSARLTAAEVEQVRTLIGMGFTDESIAQRMGVSRQAISHRRATWGMRTDRADLCSYRKSERRVVGESVLKSGASNVVAARAAGVERETTRKWRLALGLPPVADEVRSHDELGRFCSPYAAEPPPVQATQRVGKSVATYLSDRDDSKQDKLLRQLEAEYRRSIIRKMESMLPTTDSSAMPVMPTTAAGWTKHFTIGETDGYLHVTEYPDGRAGRIAITMAKAGDKDRAFLEVASAQASKLLEHGIPLYEVLSVWRGTRFAPEGRTGERGEGAIHSATSPLDFVARFLTKRYKLE